MTGTFPVAAPWFVTVQVAASWPPLVAVAGTRTAEAARSGDALTVTDVAAPAVVSLFSSFVSKTRLTPEVEPVAGAIGRSVATMKK